MVGAKHTKLEAGLRPYKDQTKTIVQGPKTREPKTKQTSVFIKSQKKFCAHKSEVEPMTKVNYCESLDMPWSRSARICIVPGATVLD